MGRETRATAEDRNSSSDIVLGPREQLFHLLAEASEIEHTLMCSYLYVSFSLKEPDTPGLSSAESEAIERWRKAISGVAIDEMAHLLIVANLSIAIGGRPHLGRPNFPVSPGYFPSGVVVRLTPFSLDTLDHLIYLERPRGVEGRDGKGFEHEPYRREEAFHGLMPSVQDYATVGDLYDALKANLTSLAGDIGEQRLFIGSPQAQVSGEALDIAKVAHIANLKDALQAVDVIVEQGEGSPGDLEESHYNRFRSIRAEYRELLAANPAFEPAWPVASNPVMRRPPTPEDKVFVDAPEAARVLDFANAVYSLLLRVLVQCFGRQGPSAAAEQKRHLDCAIGLMHVLARTSRALTRMPASATAPGVNAGMTFTMLRSVEPLLTGAAEAVLLEERFAELYEGARRTEALVPGLGGLAQQLQGARQ